MSTSSALPYGGPSIPSTNPTSRDILRTYLSGQTPIPSDPLEDQDGEATFTEIGKGTSVVVLTQAGTLTVWTTPVKVDYECETMLHMGLLCQKEVFEAFQNLGFVAVHVPRPMGYQTGHFSWFWKNVRHLVPGAYRDPSKWLVAERILPVPLSVREAMIDMYCHRDEGMRTASKSLLQNKHCLIQPLLGQRKRNGQPPKRVLSLRNFPLYVNQIEDLGIDVSVIVESMAQSLAILHWQARVDGFGIEFAIGSAPSRIHDVYQSPENQVAATITATEMPSIRQISPMGRNVHMWMLDFDRCAFIQDDEFVDMAVRSFVGQRRPFYPHPYVENGTERDDLNWKLFCNCYMDAFRWIYNNHVDEILPRLFLRRVEDEYYRMYIERQELARLRDLERGRYAAV